MSWSWKLVRDFEGTFWQTTEDAWPNSRTYLFDEPRDDFCFVNEEFSAHKIIEAAEELEPIRCRLYRLVYGSLP